MKKSVVILIAIIYVASIALVTFFGLKHNTFFDDILVEEVKITNEGIKYTKDGLKYAVLLNGETQYQIEYTVLPENAVNKDVTFIGESSSATVDENGLVTFTNNIGSIIVYVYSQDGSGIFDKIEVTKIR